MRQGAIRHLEMHAQAFQAATNTPKLAYLGFYGQNRPKTAKIMQVHLAFFECLAILQWPLEACCTSNDSNSRQKRLSSTPSCIFACFLKPAVGFVLSQEVKSGPQNTDLTDALSMGMCLASCYWP